MIAKRAKFHFAEALATGETVRVTPGRPRARAGRVSENAITRWRFGGPAGLRSATISAPGGLAGELENIPWLRPELCYPARQAL